MTTAASAIEPALTDSPGLLSLLVLLPVICVVLTGYALYPADPQTIAPMRLAVVRASLAVATAMVLGVELLSAIGTLNSTGIAVFWGVMLALSVFAAWQRDRRRPLERFSLPVLRGLPPLDRVLVLVVGGLLLGALLLALLAPPGTYDSQTYHLPKVERWVALESVELFATDIHRQVTYAPGAEYLLLHLRLLTGDDSTYNLVQYGAGLLALAAVTRIVALWGGTRTSQLLTAAVVVTAPLVLLELSSTQNDLAVAAWVSCVAMLVVPGLTARATTEQVAALGLAAGLTATTKATGLFAVGPLLVVWGIAQLRRTGVLRTVELSAAVIAIGAALAAPFLLRTQASFGHPLGPDQVREDVALGRHDPAALLVNVLRVGHTVFNTPVRPLDELTGSAINALSRGLGIDPNDPSITLTAAPFPVSAWYPAEDRAAYPVQAAAVLIGLVVALLRRRESSPVRQYAIAVALALTIHLSMIKWQEWGNRLLLYLLIIGAPLAGLWLARLLLGRRTRQITMAWLAIAALAGALTVGFGEPRRLVGPGSAVTASRWEQRFALRPQWEPDYGWAASGASAGAERGRRIGMVLDADSWEYPWWLLLPGHELVPVRSALPELPGEDPSSVDAIVCAAPREVCAGTVPPGWTLHYRTWIGYALPPPPPLAPPA